MIIITDPILIKYVVVKLNVSVIVKLNVVTMNAQKKMIKQLLFLCQKEYLTAKLWKKYQVIKRCILKKPKLLKDANAINVNVINVEIEKKQIN